MGTRNCNPREYSLLPGWRQRLQEAGGSARKHWSRLTDVFPASASLLVLGRWGAGTRHLKIWIHFQLFHFPGSKYSISGGQSQSQQLQGPSSPRMFYRSLARSLILLVGSCGASKCPPAYDPASLHLPLYVFISPPMPLDTLLVRWGCQAEG